MSREDLLVSSYGYGPDNPKRPAINIFSCSPTIPTCERHAGLQAGPARASVKPRPVTTLLEPKRIPVPQARLRQEKQPSPNIVQSGGLADWQVDNSRSLAFLLLARRGRGAGFLKNTSAKTSWNEELVAMTLRKLPDVAALVLYSVGKHSAVLSSCCNSLEIP